MGKLAATALFALLLLGFAPQAHAQISIGIQIGPPPPPRVVVAPPRPDPSYVWVEGYWYPVGHGHHYKWHDGYWTRPPYMGAQWVTPRHDGERFYPGYWDGDRGHFDHDHRWDHDRDRDYRREHRDR